MLEGLTQYGLMKDLETAAHHSMSRGQGGLEGHRHGSSVKTLWCECDRSGDRACREVH